ncbi:hypothetical protein BGW36DRAFT_66697 [Talaromyces proteolyticus]|uniref:DUF7514 domain-containing protein n=1 Tax=Talaromyces proteolyticus TaxID=1131652 RepID=A0AAD4KJN9_9EURO|nr:uncharacterized protein BGW36DRAFT_66697 [Talaromyces proteolyticus]KAH8690046.1 hypothetical protein BGW36DRAFT_66697 [Talaromyces proteolyticus]
MESPHNLGGNYWGTLINADKSAAPLLEQLCLGLVQLMLSFESSSHGSSELTPDKLARFYRELGGNCDALFLETKGPALSFIYQALGCFHTLQPTKNPFEAPCIPALLPMGFVRWQVIQLLLSPDEHSQYLQSAVSRWDVPNPTGGTFPKVIPREAFPESPDQAMLQWHEKVSRRLEKDHVHRNTPRPSPGEFGRYNSNNNNNNIPTNGSRGRTIFRRKMPTAIMTHEGILTWMTRLTDTDDVAARILSDARACIDSKEHLTNMAHRAQPRGTRRRETKLHLHLYAFLHARNPRVRAPNKLRFLVNTGPSHRLTHPSMKLFSLADDNVARSMTTSRLAAPTVCPPASTQKMPDDTRTTLRTTNETESHGGPVLDIPIHTHPRR